MSRALWRVRQRFFLVILLCYVKISNGRSFVEKKFGDFFRDENTVCQDTQNSPTTFNNNGAYLYSASQWSTRPVSEPETNASLIMYLLAFGLLWKTYCRQWSPVGCQTTTFFWINMPHWYHGYLDGCDISLDKHICSVSLDEYMFISPYTWAHRSRALSQLLAGIWSAWVTARKQCKGVWARVHSDYMFWIVCTLENINLSPRALLLLNIIGVLDRHYVAKVVNPNHEILFECGIKKRTLPMS